MNFIPMIREALGLKIEEEFQLVKSDGISYNSKCRFDGNDELQWFNPYTGCWNVSSPNTLQEIIYGQVTIKKLPFKPEEHELYYYVGLYNGEIFSIPYSREYALDEMRIKSGNCYRTEKEAEKHVDEWMSKVYGENWKELLK